MNGGGPPFGFESGFRGVSNDLWGWGRTHVCGTTAAVEVRAVVDVDRRTTQSLPASENPIPDTQRVRGRRCFATSIDKMELHSLFYDGVACCPLLPYGGIRCSMPIRLTCEIRVIAPPKQARLYGTAP